MTGEDENTGKCGEGVILKSENRRMTTLDLGSVALHGNYSKSSE